jgi:hypothetical protein
MPNGTKTDVIYSGVVDFGFKAAPNNFAVTSTKGMIFS